MITRVIKLGGSLLDATDLQLRIASWVELLQPANNIWVVGGGRAVEEVRKLDQVYPGDAAQTHWRCIEIMDANAKRLLKQFSTWKLYVAGDGTVDVNGTVNSLNSILQTSTWLRQNEIELPESWEVTSDSIAATVASEIGADQLVLLKSACPPENIFLGVLDGYLDNFFEKASAGLTGRIQIVNLRSDHFEAKNY